VDDLPRRTASDVLAWLLGEWRGRGIVSVPVMPRRDYDEVVRFTRRSEGSIDYWQRAVDLHDGSLLHSELGIWRVVDGRIEVSVALPGASEVSEGSVTDQGIVLASTSVGRASAGAPLIGTARRYELTNDSISYEISIATDRAPTFGHLRGQLHRQVRDVRQR
jgi:hypothetical protein